MPRERLCAGGGVSACCDGCRAPAGPSRGKREEGFSDVDAGRGIADAPSGSGCAGVETVDPMERAAVRASSASRVRRTRDLTASGRPRQDRLRCSHEPGHQVPANSSSTEVAFSFRSVLTVRLRFGPRVELPRGGGRRDVGPEPPARARRGCHGGAAVRALAERRGHDVLGRARAPQARHLRPERRPGARGRAVRVRRARGGVLPRAAGRARVRGLVGERRRRPRVRPATHARLLAQRQHVRAVQGVRPRRDARRGGARCLETHSLGRRAARPERAQRVRGPGIRGPEELGLHVLVLLPGAQDARRAPGPSRDERTGRRPGARRVARRAAPRGLERGLRVGDDGAVRRRRRRRSSRSRDAPRAFDGDERDAR